MSVAVSTTVSCDRDVCGAQFIAQHTRTFALDLAREAGWREVRREVKTNDRHAPVRLVVEHFCPEHAGAR